jgi:hypothetical protein
MDKKDLLADAEQKLARAQKEHEVQRFIVEHLPDGLPVAPSFVHGTAYKAYGSVKFDKLSREQAVELMTYLVPVEVVLLKEKGGCTTFLPREAYDGKVKENQEVVPVAPFIYRHDPYGEHQATNKITWWTKLGDQLISVGCELSASDARSEVEVKLDHYGGELEKRSYYYNLPDGKQIKWYQATKKAANPVTVYWLDTTVVPSVLLVKPS